MAVVNHTKEQEEVFRIEFNKTRFTVLIPILIASWAFVVELLSWYYFSEGNTVDVLEISHLLNTTFVPTHIATTTCFLYEFFSISKHLMRGGDTWKVRNESLDAKHTALTIITTILLGFLYVVLNAKVTLWTQIILVAAQIFYIVVLFKVELNEKICVYKEPLYNVVMDREVDEVSR